MKDLYGNLSTEGLTGNQEITAAILFDASELDNAQLGGTLSVAIPAGSATFDNLTLNQDGNDYTLQFSYGGEFIYTGETSGNVISSPFDMTGVNAYVISLSDSDENPLDDQNPFDFGAVGVGYEELAAETITITREGGGVIKNLSAVLGGADAGSFVITIPASTIPDIENNFTTFTVSPDNGLTAGTYSAIVTLTADNGVSESFTVTFQVLAPYAISLDVDDPTVFEIVTEGYDQIGDVTVTITNTGGGAITFLDVGITGINPDAFIATAPDPTTIGSTGETSTFSIRPANGLGPGEYSATVTVSNDEAVPESFDVSIKVVGFVTWTGNISTSWNIPDNWVPEMVPDQDSYIIIPGTANRPVISNANVIVNNLIIQDGGELIVSGDRRLTIRSGGKLTVKPGGFLNSTGTLVNNAGSGGLVVESDGSATGSVIQRSSGVQATVQRHNSIQGWHIVSPPVGGEGIFDFINNPDNIIPQNSSGDYAMTHYEEDRGTGAGGWGAYYNSSTIGNLIPGKGYLLAINTGNSAYFTGELPYSGKTVSITRSANGWNAVGNPFASAIGVTEDASTTDDFLDINAGELDPEFAALYVYDPDAKDYKIINNAGGTLSADYIQSGQGFMVKSKENGGTILFTTGMQEHNPGTTFNIKSGTTQWSALRLKVSDGNKQATTQLSFNSNMTRGLDPTYDAGQYGADESFRLYTRLVEGDNGVNMAIQALPDYGFEDMIIPIGFDFAEGGEVTFSAADIGLPNGARAILEDRELDIFTDLAHESYTIALSENFSGPGRFFVHTDIQITDVEDPSHGDDDTVLNIYSYGKEVFIVGEVKEDSYATLFDLMGRQIKTVRLESTYRNTFRVDELDRGIYLIRVSGEGAGVAKRVFVE